MRFVEKVSFPRLFIIPQRANDKLASAAKMLRTKQSSDAKQRKPKASEVMGTLTSLSNRFNKELGDNENKGLVKESIDANQISIDTNKKSIDAHEESIDDVKKRLEALTDQVRTLGSKDGVEDRLALVGTLQDRLKLLEERFNVLNIPEESVETAGGSLFELGSKINDIVLRIDRIDEKELQYDASLTKLEGESNDLFQHSIQLTQLREEFDAIKTDVTILARGKPKEYIDLRHSAFVGPLVSDIHDRLSSLETHFFGPSLKTDVTSIKEQLSDVTTKLTNLSNRQEEMTADNAKLAADYAQVKTKHAKLSADNATLQAKYDTLVTSYFELRENQQDMQKGLEETSSNALDAIKLIKTYSEQSGNESSHTNNEV